MKKTFITLILFIFVINVNAEEIEVTFNKCVDGDTAKFIYNNSEITARFLAIDTPETVHPTKEVEEFGKEAADYTCNKLKEAKKIHLEFDENSDEKDKYDRYLVWVFVDGELLQKKLVRKGLASVAYLYDDYKYTDELEKEEQLAEDEKIGIWSINETEEKIINNDEETNKAEKEISETTTNDNNNNTNNFISKYKDYIILIGALIMVSIFNLKSKKKIKNKLKNKLKNDIKKRFK